MKCPICKTELKEYLHYEPEYWLCPNDKCAVDGARIINWWRLLARQIKALTAKPKPKECASYPCAVLGGWKHPWMCPCAGFTKKKGAKK